MKINILILFLLSSILNLNAKSTDIDSLLVQKINSKFLNEERNIFIYLPDNYQETMKNYDVVYLLDGHKKNMNILIEKQDILNDKNKIPQVIIIGIPSKKGFNNRMWELIPHKVPDLSTGGANKFLHFLKDEVITYIDKRYRTTQNRTIIGWSFGGLFAVYTLKTAPELFTNLILISMCPYKGQRLLVPDFRQQMIEFFDKQSSLKKKIYISYASEYFSIWEEENIEFAKILKNNTLKDLKWSLEHFPEKNHSSIIPDAIYNGLSFIYNTKLTE